MKEYILEALERLAMPDELHKKECERLGISLTEDYEVVKQALTKLQAIEEANPSEALECLDKMIRDFNETTTGMNGLGEVVVGNELVYFHKKELETIKQALLKQLSGSQYTNIAIDEANPSEALESLIRMDNLYCAICPHTKGDCNECEYNQKSNIVYQALQKAREQNELIEEYDLKPYELREALLLYAMYKGEYKGNPLPSLKQYKKQEKENAEYKEVLRIIFEKNIDVEKLKYRLRVEEDDDDVYLHYKYDLIMTREEFELLKRWCEKWLN